MRKLVIKILVTLLIACIIVIAFLLGHLSANKDIAVKAKVESPPQPPQSYTESTKGFTFAKDFIESVYYLQLSEEAGHRTIDQKIDVTMQAMEAVMNQNTMYMNAKEIMRKYTGDENELVQKVATGIVDSIGLFEESNDDMLTMLRKLSNGDTSNSAYLVAKAKALSQEGMQKIMGSMFSIVKIIVEPKADYNGPLEFKFTKQEREILLEEINSKFGHRLNSAVVNKQAKAIYFSNEGNFYIGFIKFLSEYLDSDTYEDLSNRGISGKIYIGPAK